VRAPGGLAAVVLRPARDGLGDAADHRRRADTRLHARLAAPVDEARRLLAAERRAGDGLARATRNIAGQARGRPPYADRDVRLPARDVRHRAEPGSPLRLPKGRLRRMVGSRPRRALVAT